MMDHKTQLIKRLYEGFNARDIDNVLALLTADVMWANAMDGGHVRGHQGLRDYWTRQWSLVDPHVEPVGFSQANDGAVVVRVIQTIRDLAGNLLQGQTHGLQDKTVRHIFKFRENLVSGFDVQDI